MKQTIYDEASSAKIDIFLLKILDNLLKEMKAHSSDHVMLITGKERCGMSSVGMRMSEIIHSPQEQNPTTGRVSRRSTCKRSNAERINKCVGSRPLADVKGGGSSRVQKPVDKTRGSLIDERRPHKPEIGRRNTSPRDKGM